MRITIQKKFKKRVQKPQKKHSSKKLAFFHLIITVGNSVLGLQCKGVKSDCSRAIKPIRSNLTLWDGQK